MKIVLVGYMGSGKSTVGKILARKKNMEFLDLDAYIEEQLQLKIRDIFKQKGELFFRKKEHEYLKEVLDKKESLVLATGGGTPCYAQNMDSIKNRTKHLFYLKMSIPGLVDRLHKEKAGRPLIRHLEDEDLPEFIGKHLFERSPFYAMANHTISCDGKSAEEVTAEIEALLV